MIYLAYSILAFELLRLLVALSNLLFFQRLPKGIVANDSLVSVLIPARNEEENIGVLLACLLRQQYTNIEILVFNDQSTDQTAAIVKQMQQADCRIKLIGSDGLPPGWLGKNYACYRLASEARGSYLLFIDADVRIGHQSIGKSVAFARKHKTALLSVFPRQQMHSAGEWLTVPVMNSILLTLLPLVLVRKSGFSSLAAANGQYMFFNAGAYKNYQPHQVLRSHKVEDIETARLFKRNSEKIACLASTGFIECRMYKSFNAAVQGFSKNIIGYFGNSPLLAISFWLVTTFGIVPVFLLLPVNFTWLYLALVFVARTIVSIVSKQHILKNLALALPHQIVTGLFIGKAIINKFKKQYIWKGRLIS
ncbi:MAG: glycosyltransferase family 2 protein [Bacteroidales bacterium]|nr:glycosyltransferase family 2 protein [Bacteroidales bacterium]